VAIKSWVSVKAENLSHPWLTILSFVLHLGNHHRCEVKRQLMKLVFGRKQSGYIVHCEPNYLACYVGRLTMQPTEAVILFVCEPSINEL
jgi:hypothetical protein